MDPSVSEVETCSTGELFKYARKLNIHADTTWELRQKIIVHLMKVNGSVVELSGFTEAVKQDKEETLKEDEKRRAKLEKYLDEIKVIYETIKCFDKIKEPIRDDNKVEERDDPLISFINNEMPNVDEGFEKMSEMVKRKPSCSLLICGDSGAGKSSFINLLMGTEILPTSIRSNSSCQVRLSHGYPERAEIIDNNSNTQIIERSSFASDLSNYLENLEDRGSISCQSATIYLKSSILEGGLDIYDTIGLGETEMFNNDLKKKLNQITGIIFLLKKNNPIGDTTIGGLSEMIHSLAVSGLPWGCMHFIINMCDLLQSSDEKEALKKNVLDQLKDKCTLMSPEITTFSTKQELDFQKNSVMTNSYRDIIQLINRLHISSINTNTVKVFNFLLKFVMQTIDQITELEKYSASNKQDRKDYIFKLRNLESDRKLINESFRKKNLKDLGEEKKLCRKTVEDYFRVVETKKDIVQTVLNRQNVLHGMTQIDEIDKMIDSMVQEEILTAFKQFVEREHILKRCCEKMLSSFIQQFAEHQKKKDFILKAMNRHILIGFVECEIKNIMAAPAQNTVFIHLISPILMPIVKVKNAIIKTSLFSYLSSVFNKANIQTFYKDTSSYVTRQSSSSYSSYLSKKSNITMMMECLFKAPNQVTTDFDKYLLDDMDYLAKNIQSLEEDMRRKEKVFDTYKEIKGKLIAIQEHLCQFSLLRLQQEKKHIMIDKIKYLEDKKKPILKGRSRMVYLGQDETEECLDSCIMVYRNKNEKPWKDFYNEYREHNELCRIGSKKEYCEISKSFLELRRHILFDIEDESIVYPTFLVNGIDCSLNSYIGEKRKTLKENEISNYSNDLFNEICRLLKQILHGLKYLHSKLLVHYDLTGESIGYSCTYQSVKLTSVSLPTKVRVKHNKESENYVYKRSHLPISILEEQSKSLYVQTSDMHCLGILIYSMWLGTHPFFDFIYNEKIKTITNFVNTISNREIREITMIDSFDRGFALLIYDWFSRCRDGTLTSNTFLVELGKIRFYGSTTN